MSWKILAIALLAGSGGLAVQAAQQPSGIGRTELLRGSLSARGREVVQVRVDFPPGATFPRHRHPGEEIVTVLAGTFEYRLEGRAPVTLRSGDALLIPDGVVHEVANIGGETASELATYIVRKGRPLLVAAE